MLFKFNVKMGCLKLHILEEQYQRTELKVSYRKEELTFKNSDGFVRSNHFEFRQYDPAIMRFHTMDPLAELFHWQSPYLYATNNPVRYIDYKGLASMEWFKYFMQGVTGNFLDDDDEWGNFSSSGVLGLFGDNSGQSPPNPDVDAHVDLDEVIIIGKKPSWFRRLINRFNNRRGGQTYTSSSPGTDTTPGKSNEPDVNIDAFGFVEELMKNYEVHEAEKVVKAAIQTDNSNINYDTVRTYMINLSNQVKTMKSYNYGIDSIYKYNPGDTVTLIIHIYGGTVIQTINYNWPER